MPSQWNMFVKKVYEEGHAKDSNYQFKDALKDASLRKSEMSKMKPMAATRRMKKSMSQKKSKAAKGGANGEDEDEVMEVEETETMTPRKLSDEFDAEMTEEEMTPRDLSSEFDAEEDMDGGKRKKRGGTGNAVGTGDLGSPLTRALMAGGKKGGKKGGKRTAKKSKKSKKARKTRKHRKH